MAVSLINNKSPQQNLNKRENTFSSFANSTGIDNKIEDIQLEKNMDKPKFTADITHHQHILKLLK